MNAGEWLAGDRLPGERELAQRFDSSVITVRQALGELERERRLRRMRGRGTFVTEPPIERDLTELTSFTEKFAETRFRQVDLFKEKRLVPDTAEPLEEDHQSAGRSWKDYERLRSARIG